MPAGFINVRPAWPRAQVAVLQRQPQLPPVGLAWERVATRLGKSFSSMEGALKGLRFGFGVKTALKSTAVAAITRLVPPVAAAAFAKKVLGKLISSALKEAVRVPEVQRLVSSSFKTGTRLAKLLAPHLEAVLPAVEAIAARVIGVANAIVALGRFTFQATMHGVNLVVANAAAVVVKAARGKLASALIGFLEERRATQVANALRRFDEDSRSFVQEIRTFLTFGAELMLRNWNFIHGTLLDAPHMNIDLAAPRAIGGVGIGRNEAGFFTPLLDSLIASIDEMGVAASLRAEASGADLEKAGGGLRDAFAGIGSSSTLPTYEEKLESFGDMLERDVAASLRGPVDSFEGSMTEAVRIGGNVFSRLADLPKVVSKETAPASRVTGGLTEALALDLDLIPRIFAGSQTVARAQHYAQMAFLALRSTFLAITAFGKAVTEFMSGQYPQAAAHLTAGTLYGATAVAAGGGSPTAPRLGTDLSAPQGAPRSGPEADVFVQVNGVATGEEIAKAVRLAIETSHAPSSAHGQTITMHIDRPDASEIAAIVAATQGERLEHSGTAQGLAFAGQGGATKLGAYFGYLGGVGGPVGYLIGVALGVVFGGKAGRRELKHKLKKNRRKILKKLKKVF